ncbi:hypothetical protein [Mucilaginibacter arboris]|uniref:Uncharacterized protein n=1 Tax=Mucilaginibacter arboris TaxID=2682090 RepID=A0A7K1SX53_9SPHI|nr:hypothetical protein [Mucilaginibacter arboris]MVN21915.1 hypothetical protein [Mucilaginibacter arboris]
MSLVYPSSEIKKELQHLSSQEIATLCLRLVRFKKENKELLSYLLFKADDPDAFVKEYKAEMDLQFGKLKGKSYLIVKELRKISLEMNNHIRYTGSDIVKTELLLHFCSSYINYVDYHSHYKPLRNVFYRSVEKAKAALQKLHDDLQHDYGILYEEMLMQAESEIYWFEKKSFKL